MVVIELITRRSVVQIRSPRPFNLSQVRSLKYKFLTCFLLAKNAIMHSPKQQINNKWEKFGKSVQNVLGLN